MFKHTFSLSLDEEAMEALDALRGEKESRTACISRVLKGAVRAETTVGIAPASLNLGLNRVPHTVHSGTNPEPGCPECAKLPAGGLSASIPMRKPQICEHGAAPGLCKVAKCRRS